MLQQSLLIPDEEERTADKDGQIQAQLNTDSNLISSLLHNGSSFFLRCNFIKPALSVALI